MKVVITGITGLIGSALAASLRSDGHEVVGVSRRAGDGNIAWDLDAGTIDREGLEGADAVVHLAGETIAGRWTAGKKARIRDSRVVGTDLLARTLAGLNARPAVLVSSSAIGFYGDRPGEVLTEDSAAGDDFLADVCVQWEAAAAPAAEAGIRVVHPRTGIVLDPSEGALKPMLRLFKLGGGGKLGSGAQMWSWITLDDEVAALRHLIEGELSGPVNLTAPNPVSNAAFTKALGATLRRPTVLPAPAFALKLVLGEMADALLLTSADVRPAALAGDGFAFTSSEIGDGLRSVLG